MITMISSSLLARLETIDISALSAAEATAALHEVGVIRGRADQLEAAIARRITALHQSGHAPPAVDALGRLGHRSRRAAERAEKRADLLGQTPDLDAALGTGAVNTEHADVVAQAANRLDAEHRDALLSHDVEITEMASSSSPETFRRQLNKLVDDLTGDDGLERAERQEQSASASIRVDDDSGMHVLTATMAPEQGNRVRRLLDAEIAALSKHSELAKLRRDQLMVRALGRLLSSEGTRADVGPAEVVVLIDEHTLRHSRHDDSVCEFSDGSVLPAESARRLACDANIVPVVLGGDGQPLDVGRARRLATRAQRTALRAMYRTCAINGCDHHFDRCHIHHLIEWDELGTTDLANLLPLCSFHHHRAHEGRWRLQLDASTRELTVHLATGALHSSSLPDMLEQRAVA